MDELDKQLRSIVAEASTIGAGMDDYGALPESEQAEQINGVVSEIKQAFTKAGYIKLPNAQNITITTSDNPNDKLMTREQWEAERG